MNSSRTKSTARKPSKTAPKASAARMIHRNMHEMASVLRAQASKIAQLIRRLIRLTASAASAPNDRAFDKPRVAQHEGDHHHREDAEGHQPRQQQPVFFRPRDPRQLILGDHRPEGRGRGGPAQPM